jgi:hypothetical protein
MCLVKGKDEVSYGSGVGEMEEEAASMSHLSYNLAFTHASISISKPSKLPERVCSSLLMEFFKFHLRPGRVEEGGKASKANHVATKRRVLFN